MLLKKLIKRSRLLGLIVLCSLLTGCGSLTVYPVKDTDFFVTGEGENEKVVMSKWYFNEVLKVKLEEGR